MDARRIARWATGLAAVAWMVMIFCASAQTGSDSGGMSRGVADGLLALWSALTGASFEGAARDAAIEALQLPLRKGAHMSEYAVLAVLAFAHLLSWEKGRDSSRGTEAPRLFGAAPSLVKPAGIAWGFATLYAATDEIHQLFVPARAGLATDVLIDSTGALIGVAFALLVVWLWRRRKRYAPGEQGT